MVGMARELARRFYNITRQDSSFDCQDLVQEGCLAMLEKADEHDGRNGCSESTFCFEVIRNRLLNIVKRAKRNYHYFDYDNDKHESWSEAGQERDLMLSQLLDMLPDDLVSLVVDGIPDDLLMFAKGEARETVMRQGGTPRIRITRKMIKAYLGMTRNEFERCEREIEKFL